MVEVGSVRTVLFRLLDVPVDAAFDLGDVAFALEVSSADEMTARVLSRSIVAPGDKLDGVSIEGVAEGSVTVTVVFIASRPKPGRSGLPPDSTVAPAELGVTVVEGLRLRVRTLLEGPLQ